jgi:hypothetical protein
VRRGTAVFVLIVVATLGRGSVSGAFVLGGGSADSDCRAGFGGVDITDGQSGVVCADGDPRCDLDGVADGTCHFAPSACTAIPVGGCSPVVVDAISTSGLSLVPPDLPTRQPECGTPLAVAVPANTAVGTILRADGNGELRDIDYLNLCCHSDATPLAAARCALDVPLHIAGCGSTPVPAAARAAFARARALVNRAIAEPGHAATLRRQAVRALSQVRNRGRRLAKRHECGFAIALIASHALDTLGAPVGAER